MWRYLEHPRRSQKAIAQELGVHESRISQLLDNAFDRARRLHLQPWVLFGKCMRQTGE
jgi:DNA-directed RNA polymerase specialized sigma subunit